jgi:glyceraldehyde-3-phosphate dehydrogenase (NADP+)
MTEPTPIWVAGRAEHGEQPCEVRNPYHGHVIGQTSLATAEQVERAVCAAESAVNAAPGLPAASRGRADHVSRALQRRAECRAMISASGKPISWARTEAARTAATFRWAVEEARRSPAT